MSPPCASTNALAMASPRPARPAAAVLAEHFEDPFPVVRPDAGTLVADRDLDSRRRRAWRRTSRNPDDAVRRREPLCVVDQICHDLADQHVVDVEQGQVVRHVDSYAAAVRDVAQHHEGLGHQLIERDRDWPHLESSRFDACHVEQIGDEPGELVRLLLNQLEQFGTVLRRELDVGAAQTRNRRLDRGQRRPQVVRDGPHERAAPAVDLLEQPRPQRLVAQASPVHGESRLVGEGTEQAPFPGQLRVLQHEHSHRPIVEHQGHGDPRRRFGVGEPERAGLSAGDERRQFGRCQILTRRGSHVQTLANIERARLTVRQDQGGPPGGEGVLHRTHDMGHQLVEGEITDQSARQVVEAVSLVCSAKRLLPRRAQVRHDLGHNEDDYEVDEERNPVLRAADGQGLVGRQEEVVVGQEIRPPRPRKPGTNPAITTPTSAGRTKARAGMAMLRWSRKGRSTASSTPSEARVTTMARSVRW